uniref:Uncharacterized protein n=1 Tax=Anguilla anguilla TaxID=7936 RepID=A0A0E9U7I9_ANGAN
MCDKNKKIGTIEIFIKGLHISKWWLRITPRLSSLDISLQGKPWGI